MSGIFEKTLDTLGSFFSPLGTSSGLKNMLERCLAARTKREEEWLIRDFLRLVRAKLSEPSIKPSTVLKCLTFCIFSELCGYRAEFAYIHAVKLAQYGSLAEKKMGYLACAFLLHRCDSLSVLLVNTILRDLTSKNIFLVGMALSASCHLIPPEQTPILLPVLDDKLSHPNEYIRSKAVIVLHHFYRASPQLCSPYIARVKVLVGDKDPGVVVHALQFLSDVAQDVPDAVQDVMPALIHIQNQILDGKLPREYTYRGLHAPWMQISILRLLRYTKEPSADVFFLIQKTLQSVKPAEEAIGAAIVCECVATLVHHRAGDEVLASGLLSVAHLMASTSSNFRYAGLSLLEMVLQQYRLPLSAAQQEVVLSGLRHPDEAMKRRTLSLLCTVAEAHNAETICMQVADYVRDHCGGNPHLQHDLLDRAIALTDKFANTQTHWHIAMLIRLLPLAQDVQAKAIQRRIQLILLAGDGDSESITTARNKVLNILRKYSESKTVSTSVLEVYVWSLSQFYEGTQVIEKLVLLGRKVLCNQEPGRSMSRGIRNLLVSIVQATGQAAEKCGETTSSSYDFLNETLKSPLGDAYLRQTCLELLTALPHVNDIHQALQRTRQSETKLDFTLSFLDSFVCESLEASALPYQPKLLHVATPVLENTPLSSPSTSLPPQASAASVSSPCPSPISSGTGSIVDFPRSESVSSADSKSWSLRSPYKEGSVVKPLWSREGRIRNVENFADTGQATLTSSDSEMQQLASLLFNRQEPESRGDPLDELLNRDFEKLSVTTQNKS